MAKDSFKEKDAIKDMAPGIKAKKPLTLGRIPTGVPGLDELTEGGFERGSTMLIMGEAGCGKTSLMLQFLIAGATKFNEPGIFLSFEEHHDSIIRHSLSFGWDLLKLEEEKKLALINYKPHEVRKLAEEGGGLIWDAISELGAKRFAIDSLSSYTVLFESTYQQREAQLNLFEMVRKWGCTTLFSGEALRNTNAKTLSGMEYLTDGVILLHHPRQRNVRFRAIEVLKMRGTNHSQKICPFEFISGEGLRVYPGDDIFEEFRSKSGL